MSVKILIGCHKQAELFQNSIVIPIHLGRASASKPLDNMIGDDTGENISRINWGYNELTGIYWAWKNYEKLGNPDYFGFMHYRRLFIFDCHLLAKSYNFRLSKFYNNCISEDSINAALDGVDIIAPFTKEYEVSTYEQYKSEHCISDLDYVLGVINRKYPVMSAIAHEYMESTRQYLYNMFVMRKELFFEYCEWIFDILGEFDKNIKAQPRVHGYLAERLTGIFISYKRSQLKIVCRERQVFTSDWNTGSLLNAFRYYIKSNILGILDKKVKTSNKYYKSRDIVKVVSNTFNIHNIVICLLKKLHDRFDKGEYLLFDNLLEKSAELIDVYSLFLYMQEHGIPATYVIWKKNPMYAKLKNEGRLENVVALNSPIKRGYEILYKCFFPLLRSSTIITSFGGGKPPLKALFNASWRYVFTSHGVTQYKMWVLLSNYISDNNFSYIMSTNEFETSLFKAYGGFTEKQILKAGYPRWDLLKDTSGDEKIIFMFFTWRSSFTILDKAFADTSYVKNIISLINNAKLNELLKRNNVKLVYGVHHNLLDVLKVRLPLSNIEIANSNNISDMIYKSKMLITDYSSVLFDFLVLDKPVIQYIPDYNDESLVFFDRVSQYHINRNKELLDNFIFDEDAVVNKVEHYINNGFKDDEARFRDSLYVKENFSEALIKEVGHIAEQ